MKTNLDKLKKSVEDVPLPRDDSQIFLFGSGTLGVLAIQTLRNHMKLVAICDNNEEKQGQIIEGIPCIPPAELKNYRDPFVLISTIKYYHSIHEQLEEMNIPNCGLDAYIVRHHFEEIKDTYQLLDESSGNVYADVLWGRVTGSLSALEQCCTVDEQYFCLPPFKYIDHLGGALIDCGAYVGDTVESMVKNTLRDFHRIYAFEPTEKMFHALQKRVDFLSGIWALDEGQIVCEKKGVGRRHSFMPLYTNDASPICNYISEYGETGNSVEIVSLDEYLFQHREEKVSFIKADIEGSEWDMLQGAEQTIRRDKPMLAICIYHNIFDFFRIPQYLHTLVPEYRFFVRHHSISDVDTVLYCCV